MASKHEPRGANLRALQVHEGEAATEGFLSFIEACNFSEAPFRLLVFFTKVWEYPRNKDRK